MKVDDRLRRAADEVREAGREARFTVRAPGSRPFWARPVVVFSAAAAVVLAIGVPLLFLQGPWRSRVLEPAPTTTSTQVTTTTLAPMATVSVPGKTPAASVEDVMLTIHTAINEGNDAAHLGVVANGSLMLFYTVHGLDGESGSTLGMGQLLPSRLEQEMETGEVVVSGDSGAAVLRLVYPDPEPAWVGFNTFVAEPVAGGFLYVAGAWIAAEESAGYAEADPAVVAELLAAQAAAWAAGDVDGVLAGYWEQAEYIDGYAYETVSAAGLAGLYAGLRLEFTGEPVISGPFFAVATRVTDLASGVATDGVSVYWVREGEIALHVLTTPAT